MTNLLFLTVWLCLSLVSILEIHHSHVNSLNLNISQTGMEQNLSRRRLTSRSTHNSINTGKRYITLRKSDCPSFCTCTKNPAVLIVSDCKKDPVHSLGPLLTENLNVTSLTIMSSSLTALPLLVCNMTRLTSIDVSNNVIENLPWRCLKKLQYLTTISFQGNMITKLENGSFYDFPSLQGLDLSHNIISEIDVDVFMQLERLPFVRHIDLSNNKLVSLDPWPLMFVNRTPEIKLDNNQISVFTNRINWNFTCSSKKPTALLVLASNNISHFSDVLNGWNINGDTNALCVFAGSAKIDLRRNPFNCDCIDYYIYRFLHIIKHSEYFLSLFCNKPQEMYAQRIATTDLNKFVCHVKKSCPSGCSCIDQPNTLTMYINCVSPGINNFPVKLPKLPKYHSKYQLNFTHTNITELTYRPYLNRTRTAFFSYNMIRNISLDALLALSTSKDLHLDNNKLQYLPENISSIDLSGVSNIYLDKNDWVCDCHAKETRLWMIRTNKSISDKEGISCASPSRLRGSNLLLLRNDDLICGNPPNRELITYIGASSSALGICILVIFGAMMLRYKRIWLYRKFQWHPFDKDECEGEHKEFDVFVSYSNENEEYVEQNLIPSLEQRGYKIAFHRVNFPGGQPILVSIEQCIKKSKRTLVVFSNEFYNSSWCMWEFHTALELDGNQGTHRLITIKYEDVNVSSLDLIIRTYLKRYTYVVPNSPLFWDNLAYTLPQKKMGSPDSQAHNVVVSSDSPYAINNDSPCPEDSFQMDDNDSTLLLPSH